MKAILVVDYHFFCVDDPSGEMLNHLLKMRKVKEEYISGVGYRYSFDGTKPIEIKFIQDENFVSKEAMDDLQAKERLRFLESKIEGLESKLKEYEKTKNTEVIQ